MCKGKTSSMATYERYKRFKTISRVFPRKPDSKGLKTLKSCHWCSFTYIAVPRFLFKQPFFELSFAGFRLFRGHSLFFILLALLVFRAYSFLAAIPRPYPLLNKGRSFPEGSFMLCQGDSLVPTIWLLVLGVKCLLFWGIRANSPYSFYCIRAEQASANK